MPVSQLKKELKLNKKLISEIKEIVTSGDNLNYEAMVKEI